MGFETWKLVAGGNKNGMRRVRPSSPAQKKSASKSLGQNSKAKSQKKASKSKVSLKKDSETYWKAEHDFGVLTEAREILQDKKRLKKAAQVGEEKVEKTMNALQGVKEIGEIR